MAQPVEFEQQWWDANANLSVSTDEFHVYLKIKKPLQLGNEDNVQQLSLSGIIQWLSKKGIIFGIHQFLLEKIIATPLEFTDKTFEIATGIAPDQGKDAELKMCFVNDVPGNPQILENGRADFFHRTEISYVQQGMEIVKKIPAIPGTDGTNVFGKTIPHNKPKDIRLPVGKNVKIADDGLTLLAQINGHVVYTEATHQVNVFDTYIVNGNVDFKVGNIKFAGNVHIFGNVTDGFRVEAEGDIQINGTVGAAIVQAEGDIKIRGGIQGRGKGLVQAGGSVITLFVQMAKVRAGIDCFVRDSIMHSDVTSMRRVIVSGQKGLIVGGITRAGEAISAKVYGSPLATVTEVECGVRPDLYAELLKIDKECKELVNTKEKSSKAVILLKSSVAQGKSLTPDKQKMLEMVEKTIVYTETQLQDKLIRRKEIEQEFMQVSNASIIAEDHVYPGVKIFLSNHVYYVMDPLSRTRFIVKNDEIVLAPVS